METGKTGNSELARSTVSMILGLAYFVAVCWIVPAIPVVLALVYSLPSTIFLTLWLTGSLSIGLTSHFFMKRKH